MRDNRSHSGAADDERWQDDPKPASVPEHHLHATGGAGCDIDYDFTLSSLPEIDEVRWLESVVSSLPRNGYEGQVTDIPEAAQALELVARLSDEADTAHLMCHYLGELPREESIRALFRLITDPSETPITKNDGPRWVVPDQRIWNAAYALLELAQPPRWYGSMANRRLSVEETKEIRAELKRIAMNESFPEDTRASVREALQFDSERRIGVPLMFVPPLAALYGKWLDFKRYWTGRERRGVKVFLDDSQTEYQWGWQARGEEPIIAQKHVFIDVPRPSGLTQVTRQDREPPDHRH